jgi:hypothetical protein
MAASSAIEPDEPPDEQPFRPHDKPTSGRGYEKEIGWM